jgi:DNA-binding NarL/FixJ family response regulator
MKKQSLWDEWDETKAKIELLSSEIKILRTLERDLAVQLGNILDARNGGIHLTRRQTEIMEALCGPPLQSNKEIAAKLNIAERTVKFHISSLLAIFRVQTRYELMMRFVHPHKGEN